MGCARNTMCFSFKASPRCAIACPKVVLEVDVITSTTTISSASFPSFHKPAAGVHIKGAHATKSFGQFATDARVP